MREAAYQVGLTAVPVRGERLRLSWHQIWRLLDGDGVELTRGLVPRFSGTPPATVRAAIQSTFGPYLLRTMPSAPQPRQRSVPSSPFRLQVTHEDGWWVGVLENEPGVAIQARHTLDVIYEAQSALARLFGMRTNDVVCTVTLRLPEDVQAVFDECWVEYARLEAVHADFVAKYDRAHRLMEERFRSVEARHHLPPRHLG